jgi:hypothetical protein
MTDEEIEAKIEEFFHRNYEMLRAEGGRPLTGHMRQRALNQAKQYYAKNKELVHKVTETEVKLTLPEQRTPAGRRFSIEGVVDIVREDTEVKMYDIKTHAPEDVRDNLELYAEQLNVYAHIFQQLRGNQLDATAIICTTYPKGLQAAMKDGNPARIAREFDAWNAIVPVPFNQDGVEQMVTNFGVVIDRIETKDFAPPPLDRLKENYGGSRGTFATKICRQCDARFSCDSYRAFARSKYGRGFDFRRFFAEDRDEVEQEEWVLGNLETE